MAIFHSDLVWCRSVLFSSGHCGIHSLVSFWAWACSLTFVSLGVPCLAICRAVFIYLVLFFLGGGGLYKAFLSLVILLISAFKGLIFLTFLGAFLWVFFCRGFLVSGSVLSSTPYIGLLCLLRMHAVNYCVGDAWQRLWWDDFTHNGKQVVNRLKIPQGLSTLKFRRWSEVPSRGGVRGDTP